MWREGDEEGFDDEEDNDDMDEVFDLEDEEDEVFFSRRMRRRMRWSREQFPRPSFCRIRGRVMMLRADHVDTMLKVAAGSWANQDQKRLVRFCHAIKYRNRDE